MFPQYYINQRFLTTLLPVHPSGTQSASSALHRVPASPGSHSTWTTTATQSSVWSLSRYPLVLLVGPRLFSSGGVYMALRESVSGHLSCVRNSPVVLARRAALSPPHSFSRWSLAAFSGRCRRLGSLAAGEMRCRLDPALVVLLSDSAKQADFSLSPRSRATNSNHQRVRLIYIFNKCGLSRCVQANHERMVQGTSRDPRGQDGLNRG